MTAIIVCNGSIEDYTFYKTYFEKAELVICVDGGAAHIRNFGIKPDVLMGDFDSISLEDYEYFSGTGVEIFKFPVEKDMTDTELAVEYAIDRGFQSIVIIGGLGTRFDHSLSNIFLLKRMLDKGVHGTVVNEYNLISLVNRSIQLQREKGTKVTLLPFTEKVVGVTTKGLYYPLDNATIDIGSTWGVSNEFISETAEVTLREGLLLVIKARD